MRVALPDLAVDGQRHDISRFEIGLASRDELGEIGAFTQLLREATTRAIPMKYSSQSGRSKLMFADTQDWISDWNASSEPSLASR